MTSEIQKLQKSFEDSLRKEKADEKPVELTRSEQESIKNLFKTADTVFNTVKSNSSLLEDDEHIVDHLLKRFKNISIALKNDNFYKHLQNCEFTKNFDYELTIKSLERNLKSSNSSKNLQDIQGGIVQQYNKILKQKDDKNNIIQAHILKFVAEFLKLIQTTASCIISNDTSFAAYISTSYSSSDKEKHKQLVSENLKRFCPEKYDLLMKKGILGQAFSSEEGQPDSFTDSLRVFNFDKSGKIIVDPKSFTQGIIKDCYFISVLRSLANKSPEYLRNCFDKMSDEDLKFTFEKTKEEKLNKIFLIGFYDVDFDDLSADEIQHLGSMNKSQSVLRCKPSKHYYKVSCKDLVASGIERKGTELWPLMIEHAWGIHLNHECKELSKKQHILPMHWGAPKGSCPFPEVKGITGSETLIAKYAEGIYNSIAMATLTGETVKVEPVSLDKDSTLKYLSSLKGKSIINVFKGRKDNAEAERKSSKYTDPETGKNFMVFSGHAISVIDVYAKGGTWIVKLHDTMNSVGDKGIFHLSLDDFNKEFDNIILSDV